MDEFLKEACSFISDNITDIEVAPQLIKTPQGQSYKGLGLRKRGSEHGIAINITPFFDMFQKTGNKDMALKYLLKKVEEVVDEWTWIEGLSSYNKELLLLELVSRKKLGKEIEDIPYKEVAEDLALIVRIGIPDNDFKNYYDSSPIVTHNWLAKIGVSSDDMFRDAMEMAVKKRPITLRKITDVIADIVNLLGPDIAKEYAKYTIAREYAKYTNMKDASADEVKIFVASHTNSIWGASVVTYSDFAKKAREMVGGDFYIIPSSVHEVLVIAKEGVDINDLNVIVNLTNITTVPHRARLSDHVYEVAPDGNIVIAKNIPIIF